MELDGKGNITPRETRVSALLKQDFAFCDPNTHFLSSWCLSFERREAMKFWGDRGGTEQSSRKLQGWREVTNLAEALGIFPHDVPWFVRVSVPQICGPLSAPKGTRTEIGIKGMSERRLSS